MALGDSYPVELLDDQGNQVATEVAAVQFTDGADQPSRSGGGSQGLADVLATGNDGDGLQIKNLAEGTDPADAATVSQLGGSAATREQITGDAVTIASAGQAYLTWDTKTGGDSLLDLSNPAAPTFVTEGTYAVMVSVFPVPPGLTEGDTYNVNVDTSGASFFGMSADSPPATANTVPCLSVTFVRHFAAGESPLVNVTNNDSVLSVDFSLQATVQRLS